MKSQAKKQSGAVLAISLILLLVITLLGTANMSTTGLEEMMAANAQNKNLAFQAAEAAIETGADDTDLLWNAVNSGVGEPVSQTVTNSNTAIASTVTAEYVENTRPKGDLASSMRVNSSGLEYHHVYVTGNATIANASASHIQGTYVIGPADSSDGGSRTTGN